MRFFRDFMAAVRTSSRPSPISRRRRRHLLIVLLYSGELNAGGLVAWRRSASDRFAGLGVTDIEVGTRRAGC